MDAELAPLLESIARRLRLNGPTKILFLSHALIKEIQECRHCEEPTGPAFGRPDDRLRDEQSSALTPKGWIASRSLSSGAHSRDSLARNDRYATG
jgi:hypothetical protein